MKKIQRGTPRWLKNATPEQIEAWWMIKGPGFAETTLTQTRASLSTLLFAPRTFQPRTPEHWEEWEDREAQEAREEHVKVLARTVRDGKALEHVLVFPVDKKRIVIDGHCRVEAYRLAGWEDEVPIRYFDGSFGEAFMEAVARNSRDKLPMTNEEKQEAAWLRVKFFEDRPETPGDPRPSCREIADTTTVGKSQVYRMRDVLNEGELPNGQDPRGLSWRQVLTARRHQDPPEDDSWKEARRREYLKGLKALGPKAREEAEVFGDALEEFLGERAGAEVAKRLGHLLDEAELHHLLGYSLD